MNFISQMVKLETANARVQSMYREHKFLMHLPFIGKYVEDKIWKEEVSKVRK